MRLKSAVLIGLIAVCSSALGAARTPLIVNTGIGDYTPAPGYLYSWGQKNQAGRGTPTSPNADFYSPGLITPSVKMTKLKHLSGVATYAVGEDGSLWHWGQNNNGERGRSADTYTYWAASRAPISEDGPWKDVAPMQALLSNPLDYKILGIKADGTLKSWGGYQNSIAKNYGVWVNSEGVKTDWEQVATTGNRTVLLKDSTGSVYGFGNPDAGGNNSDLLCYTANVPMTAPTSIALVTSKLQAGYGGTVSLIDSAGDAKGCGVNSGATSGGVGCFAINGGANIQCKLNNLLGQGNSIIYALGPVSMLTGPGKKWNKILLNSNGTWSGMALATDGTVWVWGGATVNWDGSLHHKEAPRISPQYDLAPGAIVHPQITQIGSGTDWVDIALGTDFALAIKKDGSLWAWGDNSQGQLGLGHANPVLPSGVPQRVGNRSDWTAVFATEGAGFATRLNK